MTPGNEGGAGVKGLGAGGSVWEYDHSRFMNNMTMIAALEGVSNPEQYSIGAFVGDECRGEGIVMDGKAFITVHCNASEFVSFRLYNKYSCEYQVVEEGLEAQTSVGSLKAPFRMHAANLVDGIEAIDNGPLTKDNEAVYDLGGRQIVNSKLPRGIYIMNGRKVIVK